MFSLASYLSGAAYSRIDNQSEGLLQPTKKPYQAYCETEAPSRSSTPDSLIPLPLKTRPRNRRDPSSRSDISIRPLNLKVTKSRHLPVSYAEQHDMPPRVTKRMKTNNNRQVYSDCTPSLLVTVSVNRYHSVPQAVIARGSPSTIAGKESGYDHVLLRKQVEQTKHIQTETCQRVQRRVSVRKVDDLLVKSRPLPPLPVEECAEPGAQEPSVQRLEEFGGTNIEQAVARHTEHTLSKTQNSEQFDQLSIIQVHEHARRDSRSQHIEATTEGASRRTTPKDAKFMYSFGQRPVVRLDHPLPRRPDANPSLPQHAHVHARGTTHMTEPKLTRLNRPLPPLPASAPHLGPRQPPWGSLDLLSMQRQRRNEAREREEAFRFRRAMEKASWVRLGPGSVDGEGEQMTGAMRREVEGYRKQIVHVYPDMAFDGSAGKGGRSCCCAVM